MINKIQFPVGLSAKWQSIEQSPVADAYLRNWLLDTSSLTERLQSKCRQFSLQLLGQRLISPELEEYQTLRRPDVEQSAQQWQIREVVLLGDGVPWVFARSVLPNSLCNADLAGLGNKPLGQILFNDSRFQRSPFELTQFPANSAFHNSLGLQTLLPLWGRRSLFSYQSYNMMVAEVFLPDAPAYQQAPRS